MRLHVNIDHVATLRQARRGSEPDPVHAATLAELAGADGITVHLREDRRHIQERDVQLLRRTVKTLLNLEMSTTDEIVAIALETKPEIATLVPERRAELTTEGGLDVVRGSKRISEATRELRAAGIRVSLFIDPEEAQLRAAKEANAEQIELHTGRYAAARGETETRQALAVLERAAETSVNLGLRVAAGHGLDYRNVGAVAAIGAIEELNIGYSIISRAVLVGLERAVREMRAAMAGSWRNPLESIA